MSITLGMENIDRVIEELAGQKENPIAIHHSGWKQKTGTWFTQIAMAAPSVASGLHTRMFRTSATDFRMEVMMDDGKMAPVPVDAAANVKTGFYSVGIDWAQGCAPPAVPMTFGQFCENRLAEDASLSFEALMGEFYKD